MLIKKLPLNKYALIDGKACEICDFKAFFNHGNRILKNDCDLFNDMVIKHDNASLARVDRIYISSNGEAHFTIDEDSCDSLTLIILVNHNRFHLVINMGIPHIELVLYSPQESNSRPINDIPTEIASKKRGEIKQVRCQNCSLWYGENDKYGVCRKLSSYRKSTHGCNYFVPNGINVQNKEPEIFDIKKAIEYLEEGRKVRTTEMLSGFVHLELYKPNTGDKLTEPVILMVIEGKAVPWYITYKSLTSEYVLVD